MCGLLAAGVLEEGRPSDQRRKMDARGGNHRDHRLLKLCNSKDVVV